MFKLKLKTDNDAFCDGEHDEIARILREVADKISAGRDNGLCRDSNGNTVGEWSLT